MMWRLGWESFLKDTICHVICFQYNTTFFRKKEATQHNGLRCLDLLIGKELMLSCVQKSTF